VNASPVLELILRFRIRLASDQCAYCASGSLDVASRKTAATDSMAPPLFMRSLVRGLEDQDHKPECGSNAL